MKEGKIPSLIANKHIELQANLTGQVLSWHDRFSSSSSCLFQETGWLEHSVSSLHRGTPSVEVKIRQWLCSQCLSMTNFDSSF